ncbi:SDR family NAD(P)-dependent oxidoreductase, partial [Streptomyces sparsus]
PFLSTVTGQWIESAETDAGYWYRNLRQTVELEPAIRRLVEQGHGAFIEMSPHPVLTVPVAETVEDAGSDAVVLGTLRREQGGLERLYTSLGEAWAHGVHVDWTPAFEGLSPRTVDLPTYPFQRQRFWLETPAASAAVPDPVEERFWRTVEEGDLNEVAATLDLEGSGGLEHVVPALAAWRRGRQDRARLDSWRYRVVWRPHTAPGAGSRILHGTWILAVPEGRADDPLTVATQRVLEEAGARVDRMAVPEEKADRGTLAAHLTDLASSGEHAAGVLSLLALDVEGDPRSPAVPRGVLTSMALSHALADADLDTVLWTVTRGACAAEAATEAPDPAQAAAWGLLRVAGLDDPDRHGGLIDLPSPTAADAQGGLPDGDTDALAHLPALLAGATSPEGAAETEYAVRSGGVYVRRMVRSPLTAAGAAGARWRPRGTVLITGGTGALGAHVARDLARAGADHLLLTSRRGAQAPGAAELERELASLGSEVTIAACDVGDREALAELLAAVPAAHPLTAVVHTAGAVDRARPLTELDSDAAIALMQAKIAGARNLHDLLHGQPLDAFVLFSSGAGVWGNGGQAPYAAANAWLDALAEQRRAAGLPATAIAWGAWAGGGMVDAEVEEQLLRRGVPAMDPQLAVQALREAVAARESAVVVADIRWDRFVPAYCAHGHRPLIDEVPEAREVVAALGVDEQAPEEKAEAEGAAAGLLRELAGLPSDKQRRRLVDVVRTHVAAVLGLGPGESVKAGRAFRDMGFDSLTAVELRNRLGASLGTRLSATVVFDHPTPGALADHLVAELLPGTGPTSGEGLDPRLRGIEAAYREASTPSDRQALADALRDLLEGWAAAPDEPQRTAVDEELVGASDQDMFDLIDRELGIA